MQHRTIIAYFSFHPRSFHLLTFLNKGDKVGLRICYFIKKKKPLNKLISRMITLQQVSLSVEYTRELVFHSCKVSAYQIVNLAFSPLVITRITVTAFADLNRFHQGHLIGMEHKLALLHPNAYPDDKLLSYSRSGSTLVVEVCDESQHRRLFMKPPWAQTSQTHSSLCPWLLQCKSACELFATLVMRRRGA